MSRKLMPETRNRPIHYKPGYFILDFISRYGGISERTNKHKAEPKAPEGEVYPHGIFWISRNQGILRPTHETVGFSGSRYG